MGWFGAISISLAATLCGRVSSVTVILNRIEDFSNPPNITKKFSALVRSLGAKAINFAVANPPYMSNEVYENYLRSEKF